MFDAKAYAAMPPGFWTFMLFVFGCCVGSMLNVCIHRLPRGQSIIHPGSHCPKCGHAIPWYLNIPIFTWLWLGGRCAHCREPISVRYLLVEALTGSIFAACWKFYPGAPLTALVYCVLLAGLIVATFTDFEHLIIPDEITLGGMGAGFVLALLVPASHWDSWHRRPLHSVASAAGDSIVGMIAGAAIVYGVVRTGKLLFGKYKIKFAQDTKIIFEESSLTLPAEQLEYEDVFYRASDAIVFQARRLELIDRCYSNVAVVLRADRLQVGQDSFKPEDVPVMEAVTGQLTMPREAMGPGDVKFMGAIGAFIGWPGVLFSLGLSSIIGMLVGIALILAGKREWSSRMPYGPYIALAAAIWVFGGYHLVWRIFY